MNIDTRTKETTPKPIKTFLNLFLQSCNDQVNQPASQLANNLERCKLFGLVQKNARPRRSG